MARYRKVDPRIWSDEKFVEFDPFEKLMWFALLTHPLMTPMGAGVMHIGVLDDIVGNSGDWCFRCQSNTCTSHRAETYLDTFADRSLIFRDKGLVIIKNYLIYNMPDNPNHLMSWIASCEELPRSDRFTDLYEHLKSQLHSDPLWLFDGLLKPLADQCPRGLASMFWDRVNVTKDVSKMVPRKVSKIVGRNVTRNVSGNVSSNVTSDPPPIQYQEQEQEQDTKRTPISPKKKSDAQGQKDVQTRFEMFWDAYPKRLAKAQALRAFAKVNPTDELLWEILASIDQHKGTPDWQKEGGQFIPLPASWLNGRRWEDEIAPGNGNGKSAEGTVVDPEGPDAIVSWDCARCKATHTGTRRQEGDCLNPNPPPLADMKAWVKEQDAKDREQYGPSRPESPPGRIAGIEWPSPPGAV